MERWYWIELIGFDNEASDYGADAFLSRNVSTTGVSLLFAHMDLLLDQENELLPPSACSYGGHEYNRERRRQQWTRSQLRGLVDTLHSRGIKVFFATFDMTERITDPDWLCFDNKGKPLPLVYVLKRTGNTRVGDVIIDKIREFMDRYGFDGLQLADGLSSNRRSIENGDFSLSLCVHSGIDIPGKLMIEGEDAYAARRRWILGHVRFEWIEFLAREWEDFYKRLFAAIDKPIMFNNAWTRDSFEALYRYGIDYSRCQTDKAMAVMVEENSATRGITAPEDEGRIVMPLSYKDTFSYDYTLMQQDIKLITNGLSQISLMPISDTQEQWDALRHCPTELVRSIVRRYNNYVYRGGSLEVCCNAPLYCLSDGIAAEDWRWIAKQESYRIPKPDFFDGFAAVHNTDSLRADVKQFCARKRYFGSALRSELINNGLSIPVGFSLDDVSEFNTASCLLVTDLNTYTEEGKSMLVRSRLPLLVIGEDVKLPMEKKAYYEGRYLSVALYGDAPEVDLGSLRAFEKEMRRGKSQRGEIWTEPLQFRRVRPEFFRELSGILNSAFGLDRCESPDVKLSSFVCGEDRYVLLSNDRHTYYIPEIITSTPIAEATALMKEKGYKIKTEQNRFKVRIPPRCVEIVKIKVCN